MSRLGYVVIDRTRASAELVEFASRVLVLEKIGASGGRELYRPRAGDHLVAGTSGIVPDVSDSVR